MGAQLFLFIVFIKNKMAYTVTARKWRPMTFNDVIGQEHVIITLQNAIKYNRTAHAYIFSGPRGIGKTSTARILAKSLNCFHGPTTEPCNNCSNCIEITESRSMDVLEIDGASNRGIDEIRNLRENVRYVPVKGNYKIYIIDEVHMLTLQAFNALLKTLEEPPDKVIFIFATTQPYQVPLTILSRCQRFDFKRITTSDIIKQLKNICNSEGITTDNDSLSVIAKKADGSMRDAQSLLDQIVSFSGDEIKTENVFKVLGMVQQEIFFDITDNILNKDLKKGLELSGKIINEGYDLQEFFAGLIEHLRNLLVAKITNSTDLIETSENYKNKYLQTASHFKEDDILRLISIASSGEISIKRSPQPAIRMETALMKMFRIDRSVDIEEIVKKIDEINEDLKGKSEQVHIPQKPETLDLFGKRNNHNTTEKKKYSEKTEGTAHIKESTPEPSYENLTLNDIINKWDEIIKKVESEKPYVGAFLREGKPTKIFNNELEISFSEKNGFHVTSIKNNKNLVSQVFEETFHKKFIIKYLKIRESNSTNSKNQHNENLIKSLEKIKEKEPIIDDIIKSFDCRIKEIK